MCCKLVIARYNENVDWLNNVNIPYVIYNKGEDNISQWSSQIKIDNIGNEEYVYLKYIVDSYSNLPDRVIFTQANPIEHSPDFLQLLNKIDKFQDTQPLSAYYNNQTPGDILTNQSKILWIDNCRIHIDFFDSEIRRYNVAENIFSYYPPQGLGLYKLVADHYGKDDVRSAMFDDIGISYRSFDKNMTPFNYAAIFAVVKEKIQKYPKSYYEFLLQKSESVSMMTNKNRKLFGYIMEMIWMELFEYDPPKELYITNSRPLPLTSWWNNV
jgi:hypothetical protein